METVNRQIDVANYEPTEQPRHALPQLFSTVRLFFKFFFPILASALVLAIGPSALHTIANASSVLLHLLLELCRLSLFILNIFGK